MSINILDFQVANLIAAGEVVDRPASVMKELLENAIDAGATDIEAEMRRGGVSYLRVTDNGCGMSKDDAELCILRHATSKIKEARDLDSILTLGFRGEALAAISAVSQMTIVTKRKCDAAGTKIECDCGRITEVSETGAKNGTTMVVRELFANVPARRKFLKRDQSEGMAVAAAIEKIALSHPEISFRLISDGAVRLQTAGDKKLYNAIYALLGKEFASQLIEVRGKSEAVEVFGYIGRPEAARANRNYQNFFINGRYVKSRTATAALEQAFSSFMESERFPSCVLNIIIHPALVDVNVHPTKLEVKFSSEKTVFDAIYLACRNALLNDTARPALQLEKKDIDHKAIGTYNRFVPVYDRIDGDKPGKTSLFSAAENASAADAAHDANDDRTPGAGAVPRVPFDDLPFIFEDVAKKGDEAAAKATAEKQSPDASSGPGAGAESAAGTQAQVLPGDGAEMRCRDLSGGGRAPGLSPFGSGKEAFEPIFDPAQLFVPGVLPNGRAAGGGAAADENGVNPDGNGAMPDGNGAMPDGNGAMPDGNGANADGNGAGTQKGDAGAQSAVPAKNGSAGTGESPDYKLLGIAFETYILVEVGDKLLMIDKHAAHERILFEKMKKNMENPANNFVQMLLLPETVHVGREERVAALDYEKELTDAGFVFALGARDDELDVTGFPGVLEKEQAITLFESMITELSRGRADALISRKNAVERSLYTASCKAAMKGSRHDDTPHLEYIVKELLTHPEVRYCPHGRPVLFEIPKGRIETRFQRS